MDLRSMFPPFGLRIDAGNLTLRPITDEVLPELVEVALAGVHDPAFMPFAFPWTDAPRETLIRNFAQYHWGLRTRWSVEAWSLDLAVEVDGQIVGTQGFGTNNFLTRRAGETGSWLGLQHQGRGIGTRMRQALCAFVFDHLDATEITSAAYTDNQPSLTVSRKVGYEMNGEDRVVRRGEPAVMQRIRVTPETLVRGEAISVTGVTEFRKFIGLDAS